jgi:hypothetical protein
MGRRYGGHNASACALQKSWQPSQTDLSYDPEHAVPNKTDDLLEGSTGQGLLAFGRHHGIERPRGVSLPEIR